jgi:hypothetical protein
MKIFAIAALVVVVLIAFFFVRHSIIANEADVWAQTRLLHLEKQFKVGMPIRRVEENLVADRFNYDEGGEWDLARQRDVKAVYVKLPGGSGIFQGYYRLELVFDERQLLRSMTIDQYAEGL